MTTDTPLPELLADRGPCSDCGTSMRDCWVQAGSVCCGSCTHPAASTTSLDAEKGALAEAWSTGHMLGETLAYNALADLLWRRHREVITRGEYRELRAARVAALPHWDTNPHVLPPGQDH